MLFYENLEEIIFRRHELFESDELIILSGYVGPKPVERLSNLPFRSTVIYGMYSSENIKATLHNVLTNIHNNHTKIIFHSFVKCFDVNVVKNRYRLQTCTDILKF